MNVKEFKGPDASFKMEYFRAFRFEIGECYIGKNAVAYVIFSKYNKFSENAKKILSLIGYEDENMEMYFSPTIPHFFKVFPDEDGNEVLILKKEKNVIPLTSFLEYCNESIDGKHVAWIITRLLNFEAFLNYNGIVHNGLCIDNCFVDPASHSVLVYGGWWYSTLENTKMIGTNSSVFDVLPQSVKDSGISSFLTDINSIKQLGFKLSGWEILEEDSGLPEPMAVFFTDRREKELKTLLAEWEDVKQKSYGKPKFIEITVDYSKIYKN